MRSLQERLTESLLNEGADYTLRMPCTDPSQMEDIYWAIKDEFGEGAEMSKDDWTYGDEYIKCYVHAKSTSQIKKFAKEYDAEFEKR